MYKGDIQGKKNARGTRIDLLQVEVSLLGRGRRESITFWRKKTDTCNYLAIMKKYT